MAEQPPPASGVRVEWRDIPRRVRAAIESRLGSRVVAAVNQPGGFSPGLAARVQTADGGRAFVKAVGPEPNPDSPQIHRREARVVAALPAHAPAPRLLWTFDEGADGWVVLAFEDIAGHPPAQPWRADELDRVLAALAELSALLTPAPIEARAAGRTFARALHGWDLLVAGPTEDLDAWSRRHLDRLAALEAAAPDAVAGETLLHIDIRADNLLLTEDRVVVVDWPHVAIGAAWVDVLGFAPSVAMQGGPEPWDLFPRHPAARQADPKAVTAALASLAGFFTYQALLPAPPGLPTLRAFQAAQGAVARRWLQRRTGWT